MNKILPFYGEGFELSETGEVQRVGEALGFHGCSTSIFHPFTLFYASSNAKVNSQPVHKVSIACALADNRKESATIELGFAEELLARFEDGMFGAACAARERGVRHPRVGGRWDRAPQLERAAPLSPLARPSPDGGPSASNGGGG